MKRIAISRAEYESKYGFPTQPNQIGATVCTPSGEVLVIFEFIDEMAQKEIDWLEHLYNLT